MPVAGVKVMNEGKGALNGKLADKVTALGYRHVTCVAILAS